VVFFVLMSWYNVSGNLILRVNEFSIMNKKSSGFTLIELLVVIAIIGIMATIVMAVLGSAKGKSNDSKVQSQLKSMVNQALLFSGAQTAVTATTTAPTGTANGTIFNSTTTANNSLYSLINSLPSGTVVYYGKQNTTTPALGGAWFFAASTSTGAFCVDNTGTPKIITAAVMTTSNATDANHFPNAATNYTCS